MLHFFDVLVLLISIPSETSILLYYGIYNLYKILFIIIIFRLLIQNFLLKHIAVVVIFIFIKNWLNEYYNIKQSQWFFWEQRIVWIDFDFCKITRNSAKFINFIESNALRFSTNQSFVWNVINKNFFAYFFIY